MAPSKFDDLCKPAKDVLGDDYQESGYNFKAKAKTNFEGLGNFMGDADGKSGATLTTAIDFDASKTSGGATPAKLTWKFPKPLGWAGIAFDKLEMDKAGKMKLEASIDKGLHGVNDCKIECKSGLEGLGDLMVGATYTGVADALVKAEFTAMNPANYTAELAYAVGGGASVSLKSTPKSTVDVGARYANGPMTFSLTSKEKFAAFTFHGFYKLSDDFKLASTYNYGGEKGAGAWAAGLGYTAAEGTFVKGKLTGVNGADLAVSTSVKMQLAKGATVTAGAKMPVDGNKAWTYGVAFNIE